MTRIGERVIHREIDLDVRKGEILAIIGGSGAGKTTLLRTLIGLRPPSQGQVKVLGRDLYRAQSALKREVRMNWGIVFQGGALFSALSVFDNIALPLRELRLLDEGSLAEIVMLKLMLVGLDPPDANKLPAELSGGMVKRAALARAIVLDPDLLFLDEPTAGLDPVSATAFQGLIRDLRQELGLTVVMVTHDLDTLETLADRVAVLADSRLIALAPLAEVLATDHPFIREYFASERLRRPSPEILGV
ncbi:MAG: ATP-binding cassette domain-containing protein [Vicinamibacteria bacterium]|jgi:phospholipid/cholesterol/gamma-HCH transport system ATP-binding protein|nr:ATP-binding cassette domain-containing protein [Vicinamibacteria bacterium]